MEIQSILQLFLLLGGCGGGGTSIVGGGIAGKLSGGEETAG
jgi:hypothetical protein